MLAKCWNIFVSGVSWTELEAEIGIERFTAKSRQNIGFHKWYMYMWDLHCNAVDLTG
jgi:hypothetical protein